jgi:hypothetical protein
LGHFAALNRCQNLRIKPREANQVDMLDSMHRRLRGVASLLLAGCLFAPATGCALWNDNSNQGPADPTTDIGAKLRKPTAPGQASGFDSRAKEIEKNLGVR